MASSTPRTALAMTVSAVAGAAVVLLGVWLLSAVGAGGGDQAASQGPAGGGPGGPGASGGGPSGGSGGGPPPATVRLGMAERRTVQSRFQVVGRLQEIRRATVAAEVSGKIVQVPVEEGDAVIGGKTVLARIEDTWAKLELAAAEAEVASAEATLDQSELDLRYLERLLESESAKPREGEDQRATVASNRADLKAAVARRNRAEERTNRLAVVAPFDGWVVDKLTEVGQWAEAGSAVAEVISRGEIEAVVNVPERLINRIEVGDSLELNVDAIDIRTQGQVASVTPSGRNTARTFPVKVRLPDHEGKLKPGMSVTASLPTSKREDRLTVPRDAVFFQPTGAVVWIAQPGERMPTAAPVQVRVLFPAGDRYAIEPAGGGDLQPEMRVVTEGAELLMPGQPLNVNNNPVASDGEASSAERGEEASKG